MMKIIFVIGKYNDKTPYERARNIAKAREAAEKLWALGYYVICPHTNSAHFIGCSEEQFYKGYQLILKKCAECAFVLDNYKTSPGSLDEIEVAEEKGISIYYNMKDVLALTKELPK